MGLVKRGIMFKNISDEYSNRIAGVMPAKGFNPRVLEKELKALPNISNKQAREIVHRVKNPDLCEADLERTVVEYQCEAEVLNDYTNELETKILLQEELQFKYFM